LFKRDNHYVVRDDQITIVDEFTGRLMPGRRFSEGLHQALEAKENVTVQRESKTLATITFQNYFRLYTKIAGMTGTAKTEEEEFRKIYGLDVYVIPTNKPIARKDSSDLVFKTENGKYEAITREVKERNNNGQPVLIGTVSIEKNEQISKALAKAGIRHDVLNAKNHEQEARIIAQAGRFRGVTLATNIAGRGVDIILGGSPYNAQEAEKVKAAGGLHVLGTERHESRRIDNQLRGRSGRQGDPGSTQFFVSLEDDLIKHFGGERVQQLMTTLGIPDDAPIEHNLVSRVIESAQKKIEGLNFDVRKHVLEFDDVMNKHREVIYRIRDRALKPDANLKDEILEKISAEVSNAVISGSEAEPNQAREEIIKTLSNMFPFDKSAVPKTTDTQVLTDYFMEKATLAYAEKEKQLGTDVMRSIERAVILRSMDSLWMEHIDTMEHLRSSVRLRGYAQKDPLIEYKREGYALFEHLLADVDKNIAFSIYKVELRNQPATHGAQAVQRTTHTSSSMALGTDSTDSAATSISGQDIKKIGRNDPCWCGSGKKFKKCHGK
jgi:preprotein translocase subunit SecA